LKFEIKDSLLQFQISNFLVLTDFVASSPKGKKDGSQGLERSVNPWDVPKRNMHPEGMREQREAAEQYLASLQDALLFSDSSRDLRFAPIPGYHLKSLRDNGPEFDPIKHWLR
jgi:hypothetical protein